MAEEGKKKKRDQAEMDSKNKAPNVDIQPAGNPLVPRKESRPSSQLTIPATPAVGARTTEELSAPVRAFLSFSAHKQARRRSQANMMPPVNRGAGLTPPINHQLPQKKTRNLLMPRNTMAGVSRNLMQPSIHAMSQPRHWMDDWEPVPRRIIAPVSKDIWDKMEQLNKNLMSEPRQVSYHLQIDKDVHNTEDKPPEKKKKKKKGNKEKSEPDTDNDPEKQKEKKKKRNKKGKDTGDEKDETQEEGGTSRPRKSANINTAHNAATKTEVNKQNRSKSKSLGGNESEVEIELKVERSATMVNEEDEDPLSFDPSKVVDPGTARSVARIIEESADPTESHLIDPTFPAKCECCTERNDFTRAIIREETVVARPHYLHRSMKEDFEVSKRDNGLGFYRSDSRILIPVSYYVEKKLGAEMLSVGHSHGQALGVEQVKNKSSQSTPRDWVEWPYYQHASSLPHQMEEYVDDQITPSSDSYILSETIYESDMKMEDAMRRLKKSISKF